MGIKTRYREKPEEIPATEKLITEPAANAVKSPNPIATDEATIRLQRQLAELQQAEGFQHLVAVAANQASQEGHAPYTDAHNHRTRQLVDQHLGRVARAVEEQPAPIRQPAPPPLPPEPDRSSQYSAPVSREAPNGSGRREPPSQVRLSPAP